MSDVASSKSPANDNNPKDQQHGVNGPPQEANTNTDTQAAQQQQNGDANDSSAEPDGGYPPQIHAGAVGLGPEYGAQQRVVSCQVDCLSETAVLIAACYRLRLTRYKD